MSDPSSTSRRLDSWKAIARHLGRSVRTVRRWEAAEGLPVRRHMHNAQASVYAFTEELEDWVRQREQTPAADFAASVAATAALPDRESDSIAVLPFSYAGPSDGPAWIAEGLTEEVIGSLSGIHGLRVISRTSSAVAKAEGRSLTAIGRALGVRRLLEGGVVADGGRFRISARLFDVASEDRVWSETFAGTTDEAFDLQERIARRVAAAMSLPLDSGDEARLARRTLDHVDVWPLLLEARQEAMRWRGDAIARAESLLSEAIERAGEEAELCVAMGHTKLQYREAGLSPDDHLLDEAEAWARRAAQRDPHGRRVHQLQGWIHFARGKVVAAIGELRTALLDDWNNANALSLLAYCWLISGRVGFARPVIDRLLAVDPLTPLHRCLPGWADALEGRFGDAVTAYRSMYEADPGNPVGRLFYVWILVSAGEAAEARRVASGFPAPLATTPAAEIAALLSHTDGPMPEISDATRSVAQANEMFPRLLAQACAVHDDADGCAGWLRLASERGFINHPFLAEHDPLLARVRSAPPVARLLDDIRLRWERFEA